MYLLLFTFIVIFLVNLLPAFAPPTWMVLAFISFNYPISNLFLFVLVGAIAATSGRFILAASSGMIVHKKLISKEALENIGHLRTYLEKRRKLTFSIFLFEAFTPLPSSQLFVAYGLTRLRYLDALVPFFIGRLFTYSFWTLTARELSNLASEQLTSYAFVNGSFVLIQIGILAFLYLFMKLDWKVLLNEHRVAFIKVVKNVPPQI